MYSFLDFSIVIPTYNGASHQLKEVIQALERQEKIVHLAWEIIVVDNNSRDHTSHLVYELQSQWIHPFPLRYVQECKQGNGHARFCGVQHARGEFVGFLDDDNIPSPDWILEAYQFGKQNPKAGVWNGKSLGLYECEPEPAWKPLLTYLAIYERGNAPRPYHRLINPPGAGLVVRRSAWLASIQKVTIPGRTPTSLLSSEDLEISILIQRNGWEIWYNPRMMIHHYIPKSRLDTIYFSRLMDAIGVSRHPVRYLRLSVILWPLMFILYFIKDTIWLLRYVIIYWRSKNKFLARYQLILYWGLWRGPWYFLHQKLSHCLQSIRKK